jgi:glycosyltransferase involved in cell wall biosynthesis
LKDEDEVKFVFVGGGTGWEQITKQREAKGLKNVICLPYQPLNKVGASLGAADLHVVAMGQAFVGLVHPCKVYNLLSLGLPWVGLGPRDCHLVDLWKEVGDQAGCEVVQGADAAALARLIQERASRPKADPARLKKVGENYRESVLAPRLARIIVQEGKAKGD